MGMNIKFFYVGHGAMNYLQIFDDLGNVISHFLVEPEALTIRRMGQFCKITWRW